MLQGPVAVGILSHQRVRVAGFVGFGSVFGFGTVVGVDFEEHVPGPSTSGEATTKGATVVEVVAACVVVVVSGNVVVVEVSA